MTKGTEMVQDHEHKPIVGIIMGSDSDWPVMQLAADALNEFGIPWEAAVLSAHRMPDDTLQYAREAAGRGLRAIIAGAGGAAHLPGVLAAGTTLPVVGVPIALKVMDGLDSLLSIVQMPSGVPVATVGIGAARNAGLLVARIIASGNEKMTAEITQFQAQLREEALAKGAKVREASGH